MSDPARWHVLRLFLLARPAVCVGVGIPGDERQLGAVGRPRQIVDGRRPFGDRHAFAPLGHREHADLCGAVLLVDRERERPTVGRPSGERVVGPGGEGPGPLRAVDCGQPDTSDVPVLLLVDAHDLEGHRPSVRRHPGVGHLAQIRYVLGLHTCTHFFGNYFFAHGLSTFMWISIVSMVGPPH